MPKDKKYSTGEIVGQLVKEAARRIGSSSTGAAASAGRKLKNRRNRIDEIVDNATTPDRTSPPARTRDRR